KLVAHVQRDQHRRRETYRKPRDVDETVELVPQEAAYGHRQRVAPHEVTCSFVAQRVYGIGARQTQGDRVRGGPGEQQCGCAGGQKVQRIEGDPIRVAFEPPTQIVVSDGPGDEVR